VGGGGQEQRLGLVGLLQPGDVAQGMDDLDAMERSNRFE